VDNVLLIRWNLNCWNLETGTFKFQNLLIQTWGCSCTAELWLYRIRINQNYSLRRFQIAKGFLEKEASWEFSGENFVTCFDSFPIVDFYGSHKNLLDFVLELISKTPKFQELLGLVRLKFVFFVCSPLVWLCFIFQFSVSVVKIQSREFGREFGREPSGLQDGQWGGWLGQPEGGPSNTALTRCGDVEKGGACVPSNGLPN